MRLLVNGIPLESWLLLPVLVIIFYIVFRWRRYGEEPFTWNHEYFERACYVGGAVWMGTILSSFLINPLHVAILWVVLLTLGTFILPWHWTETTLPRAVLLSLFAVVVGVLFLPVPGSIHRFLFGPSSRTVQNKSPLAGIPVSTFTLDLPPEWEELPGHRPHLYQRRGSPKSGVFQTSFETPPEHLPADGPQAAQQLADLLKAVGDQLKIGEKVFLQVEDAAAGRLAFARYRSEAHGLCQCWLLFAEPMVFASYTESIQADAEQEIGQLHQTLKSARFVESIGK